ncbi:hypothetical protein Vretimale_8289 [Volvox reticuliferus]|uniref:Uncharacterized protein n=1 Tax=Volvox reticuliferus TaxID=1737510 RepID=A0A8J4GAW9_9CHLO|nr:hypothetical protein Vretifemale_11602 [Volvox reticuliferus]GIM03533.1 hypothetical protein Vretimale_8289 [Volvox reticuliferus]
MMEGRPRSAVRTASAVAVVSASTEFLERGAMVGAGQYGVPKKASFGANALSPLVLPQQPAATSPLTSPAPPTPDPPTATAADLHAMVIALDESRDFHSASPAPSPRPTAPASPSPLSSHSPDRSTPPSPGPLASSSPTLDLEPTPGSLKLFCSGTVGEIIRSPSPGPRPGSGSRASLTLIPRGIRANSPSTNTPTARHAAGAFPLSIDVGNTAAAAAHSSGSSPQRQQGWLESVYSPKSPSTGCSGPGSGSPMGAGKGMMAPDVPPAVRSPMGSPGRQWGSGTPAAVMSTSSSSPGRTGVSRAATSLQHVYGPMPPPPPVMVVASADADWSHTGGGEDGGDGAAVANGSSANGDTAASDLLPVKEGLRAYYLLSPPSPSAVVKPAMGSPERGSNPGSSAERSGSPRRGAPVVSTAATLRSDGGHVERPAVPAAGLGQGPVPGPGPGSAAVAAGRVSPGAGRVSTAWSGRGRSPYAVSAAAQGTGPFRSQASASVGSAAGSPPPPTSQQQQQQQGSDRRAARREELFEEQDPEVVLEQSIALLSEIEGHIRESVGLQPDHPLQSIDPDLAQDIPLQLVEALEDTLEVIAMAREELARNRVGDPGQDRSRDRERDGDRDRHRGPRQPSHGPGTSLSPYAQYRSIGGASSAGGARGRVSRTGSQPGNGLSSGGGGSAGGYFSGTSRPPRGSWAGGGGPSSSFGGAGPTHGGSPGSHLPPIGGSSSSGGGAGSGRNGTSLYGRPPSQQHSSRPSSRQQHPHTQPPQPPRSSSISRRTSGSLSSGGGAGAGGGSMTSIPSLAATISSRRAWHREPPPEEWVAAKQARADSERRKREAQLAADLRYLQQIRGRASEVQQTHEALLAQAEESVRAARSAKASTEAQHRWLQYQDTVTEGAKRHYENLMAQQHGAAHAHDGACGPTRYRVY